MSGALAKIPSQTRAGGVTHSILSKTISKAGSKQGSHRGVKGGLCIKAKKAMLPLGGLVYHRK